MTVNREEVKRRKRLTRAMKNPALALDRGWVEDPKFCADFLDRCDQLALVQDRNLLEIARRSVEVADACGDRHLYHRSHGVLSHAYVARGDHYWAGKTLDDVREQALGCCPRCRAEHFQRLGDLLMEERELEDSLAALNGALEPANLDADARGRIHFVRGITHHLLGNRGRALADAGATLELVDLSSPRGLFVDTGAFIPIYVKGGDPEHDRRASSLLAAFDRRIKGKRGWGDWTTRRVWADVHLQARQGNFGRARILARRAYARLLADGLAREAAAITLDLGQLLCRREFPAERDLKAAVDIIGRVVKRRPDLTELHREGFAEIREILESSPWSARSCMVQLRRSFIAPVPGVMAERMGPG